MPKTLVGYLVPLLIVALVMWRASRAMKGRPVKPSRLWIRPALIGVFMVLALTTSPAPGLFALFLYAVAAAAGIGLGFLLARHQELTLDPTHGTIISKTSPVGVILFVGLFVARYAFKSLVNGGQAPDKLAAHSPQITLYTDVGLLFLLALVTAQAWEIWRRSRPLMAEKAARAAAKALAE